jgi:hypothetical protein
MKTVQGWVMIVVTSSPILVPAFHPIALRHPEFRPSGKLMKARHRNRHRQLRQTSNVHTNHEQISESQCKE